MAGFQVTILYASESAEEEQVARSMPFVGYGPHKHTDSLRQELEIPTSHSRWDPLGLEFMTATTQTAKFPNPPLPTPWRTLLGIAKFSALPVSRRWNLLNYIEKVWEKKEALPNSLDLRSAESWLTSIGQPLPVQNAVWNPLCRFLLGASLSHTRAGSFTNIVTRVFFQSSYDRPHIPEYPDFISSLTQALHKQLEQLGVTKHPVPAIEHLQVSSERISGVCLSDGTIRTADWYVSALPPKMLTSLLSERLLARYAMFHQMSQQTFAPIIAFNVFADGNIKTPRFLLHPGPFAWTLCRGTFFAGEPATLVSCVSLGAQDLFSQTDDHLTTLALQHLDGMAAYIPHLHVPSVRGHSLVRQSLGFTPQTPGVSPSRPSNHTPLSNLFLTGSWTDTNATSELESAICSGDLCAQAVTQLASH